MKTNHIKINKQLCLLACVLLVFSGCKKLIEIDAPVSSTNGLNVYNNNTTAAAVLTGVYATMSKETMDDILTGVSQFTGLSADELVLYDLNGPKAALYNNSLTANGLISWNGIYTKLFTINTAIQGLNDSKGLLPGVKSQLLGEAKFMRAYFYFYLVNLFGDVPLALTNDYKINSLLPRTSTQIVYNQIISDLMDAKSLLSEQYLNGDVQTISNERVRPNKAVASALLSRVYLFVKDFKNAESESTILINNSSYSLVPLTDAFLKTSKEAIWQLYSVGGASGRGNTSEGMLYVLPTTGPNGTNYPVYLSNFTYNSFQAFDQRKVKWVGSVTAGGTSYIYPYKYKTGITTTPDYTEYSIVFRLAEQYLIRAEARIELGNVSGGVEDLNAVRLRATDLNADADKRLSQLSTTMAKPDALLAVEHERQVELFSEFGDRWFTLKRMNRANAVLGPIKGTNWQTTDQLYPIPQSDINLNPNLKGHQNPGYQ